MKSIATGVLVLMLVLTGCAPVIDHPIDYPESVDHKPTSKEDELARDTIWAAMRIGYNAGRAGTEWAVFSNVTGRVIVDAVRVCQ